MSPMLKQNVGMTKIYAKGIAELFLIRCNPYHWDGSGEVPDNISFDVYKRKIDETYDGCTLEIQLCKLTIKEAFDKLVKRNAHGFIDYSYSDGTDGYLPGRELLEFCDEATAAKLIEAR